MSTLVFNKAEVDRVFRHSLAAPAQNPSPYIGDQITEPSFLFVHDDGIYLMSNGVPFDRDGEGAFVAYAAGCNPHLDEDWYANSRSLVGGDDFAEIYPVSQMILDAGGDVVLMEVSDEGIKIATAHSDNKPMLYKADGSFGEFPPANGTDYTLEEVQKAVGGYIQVVPLGSDSILIINEEGKLHDLPYNEKATFITKPFLIPGDRIVGDAIVCPTSMLK